ncbi:hypothetical protein ABZT17_37660 [Streptomyces sp. NPDC005648]|uniref:hypothetical protein n=1 Tax=Streptomyces sp. NPDC005648 TaxID=3157044 RepID=UPI0033A84F66
MRRSSRRLVHLSYGLSIILGFIVLVLTVTTITSLRASKGQEGRERQEAVDTPEAEPTV